MFTKIIILPLELLLVSVTETVLLTHQQKLAFQLCIPLSYFNVFVSKRLYHRTVLEFLTAR